MKTFASHPGQVTILRGLSLMTPTLLHPQSQGDKPAHKAVAIGDRPATAKGGDQGRGCLCRGGSVIRATFLRARAQRRLIDKEAPIWFIVGAEYMKRVTKISLIWACSCGKQTAWQRYMGHVATAGGAF